MGVHGLSALIFLILTEQTLLRGKIFSELGGEATCFEGPEEFLLDFDVCGEAN